MSAVNEFLQRLKQRKLVQWTMAYVAAVFALLQGLDIIAQRFSWPDWIERALIIASCVGFFVVVVLAWYHGERGAQRVTGIELLILALLLSLGGALLWRFATVSRQPNAASTVTAPSANAAQTPVSSSPPVAIPAKSIAVMPFVNMTGDEKEDYLSDGMTEELLSDLAQVKGLRVPGRSSSFAFKGQTEEDLFRKVGAELHVRTVLEGSVCKAGDKLRITAPLINVADGYQLWSEEYNADMKGILSVESDVALRVVDALKINGSLGCDLYWARRYDEAMRQLRDTIDLYPDDAFSHFALGWCLIQKGELTAAKADLQKATELDDLSWFIGWLGYTYAKLGDRIKAEQILRDLDELAKRRYVTPNAWVPVYLGLGDKEKALDGLEQCYKDQDVVCWQLKIDQRYKSLRDEPRFQSLLKKVRLNK